LNYAEWKFWLDVMVLVGVAANTGYTWWTNREKVTNRRFKAQEDEIAAIKSMLGNIPATCSKHAKNEGRLDGHNDRLAQHKELLTSIETEFKHLPKRDDLEKVYERINKVSSQMADLKAEVGKISGAMLGITHITEMINDFLVQQGGKK
jgi:hypothetical protein